MSTALIEIFEQEYRELRPRAPMPALDIRFRRFTSLNTTIRLREGRLLVRLSDLLEAAPETVHRAIAHILLAKLYKKPIARGSCGPLSAVCVVGGGGAAGGADPADARAQDDPVGAGALLRSGRGLREPEHALLPWAAGPAAH